MAFDPSGKCSVFVAAARVAAGVQSTGRLLPNILPELMGPEAHLACARQLPHPFVRVPLVPAHIARALQLHKVNGDGIVQYRQKLRSVCGKLAGALEENNALLVSKSHKWLQPILSKRKVMLMMEFNYIINYEDHEMFCDLIFGLPMLGWARHYPVSIQRTSQDPLPLELHDDSLKEHNESIVRSLGLVKSPEQDAMARDKCLVDFSSGGLVGPFYSFAFVCNLLGEGGRVATVDSAFLHLGATRRS